MASASAVPRTGSEPLQLSQPVPTSHPESPVPIASRDGRESQSHSPSEHQEDKGSHTAEGKRKLKRPRLVLSCTECVRRKTKCDRHVPCAACVRRGNPHKCRVDEVDEAPVQPFALASDHFDLKKRVAFLESLLKAHLPGINFPYAPLKTTYVPGQEEPPSATGGANSASLSGRGSTSTDRKRQRDRERSASLDSGTENAAMTLEMVTLGKSKSSSRDHNPIDAIGGGRIEQGRAQRADEALQSASSAAHFMHTATSEERKRQQSPMTALSIDTQTRIADFAYLRSVIPSRQMSSKLIDSYINRIDFTYHTLHYPTFVIEVNELWELVDSNRFHEIDPAWLAQYLMITCLGMLFLSPDPQVSPEQHKDLPPLWFGAAQRALHLADWTGKPQLRCVAAILLFTLYLLNIGEVERLVVWVSSALRIAQILGLHTLDDSNDRIPNDPLAYASGPPLLKREMGKRLFWLLVYLEWNVADRSLGLRCIRPEDFTTPPPRNYEDEDLMHPNPKEQPLDKPTRVGYEILRIGLLESHQKWQIEQRTTVHTYQSLLEMDDKLHKRIAQLPRYFHPDHINDLDVRVMDQQKPWLALQRCVVNLGLHNRIMRLHRPYLTRGCKDKQFELSAKRCVHSARMVLASIQVFRTLCDSCDKFWFVSFYTFSSALVLLVHSLATKTSAEEFREQQQEIMLALACLRAQEPFSVIARSGVRVLEGLLHEGTSRTQPKASAATQSSPGSAPASASARKGSKGDSDHVHDVLNRIVRHVGGNGPATPGGTVASGHATPRNITSPRSVGSYGGSTSPVIDSFNGSPPTVPGSMALPSLSAALQAGGIAGSVPPSLPNSFFGGIVPSPSPFAPTSDLATAGPAQHAANSFNDGSASELLRSFGFTPPLTTNSPWLSTLNVGLPLGDAGTMLANGGTGAGSTCYELPFGPGNLRLEGLADDLGDLSWIDGLGGTV